MQEATGRYTEQTRTEDLLGWGNCNLLIGLSIKEISVHHLANQYQVPADL